MADIGKLKYKRAMPKVHASAVPLLRTFAAALLCFSTISLILSIGISFLSSLLCIIIAGVILSRRRDKLESDIQGLPPVPPKSSSFFFAACCRCNNVSFLGHIHALAFAVIILGCVEAIGGISFFFAVGIPITARFTDAALSVSPPFFSQFPSQNVNSFFSWTGGRSPPLPEIQVQNSYLDFDGGGAFIKDTSGCMAVGPSSTQDEGRFRALFPTPASSCTMTTFNLWRNFWNNGRNSFTQGYRSYLVRLQDFDIPNVQNRMFDAYDAAWRSASLGTFSTAFETFAELFSSSVTIAGALSSFVNCIWGLLTISILYSLSPGSQLQSTQSFFSFFHYSRTNPTPLFLFNFALAMFFCGLALLPGPTVLTGLGCLYLSVSWMYLLREPKAIEDEAAVRRMRIAVYVISAVSVVQALLSGVFLWRAITVGTGVSPPPRSSFPFSMPRVPSVDAARDDSPGFITFLSSESFAVLDLGTSQAIGSFNNFGTSDLFNAATLTNGRFVGPTVCIAASTMNANGRVSFFSMNSA